MVENYGHEHCSNAKLVGISFQAQLFSCKQIEDVFELECFVDVEMNNERYNICHSFKSSTFFLEFTPLFKVNDIMDGLNLNIYCRFSIEESEYNQWLTRNNSLIENNELTENELFWLLNKSARFVDTNVNNIPKELLIVNY